MMDRPVITVFMAVYNGSRYLRQAIDSILSQTFSAFELLIIDDGSTDNSVDIVHSYADPRIRLLHNDGNKGLVFTRNRGALEADGEFLAILDCDDIAFPNRLEIQYNFFRENPEVALCSGRALYLDRNGRPIGQSPVFSGDKNLLLLFGNILVNSAVMIKTEVIKAVGSYNAHAPAEDYDLALRIAENHPIATIENILVKYRIHDNNTSMSSAERLMQVEKNILRNIHAKLGIKPDERRVLLHHSFICNRIHEFALKEYKDFLVDLSGNDHLNRRYDFFQIQKILFQKWFEVIMVLGGRKTFLLLFQSPFYHNSVLSFKQLRKAFKKSVKDLVFN
jgi:glycosyltransferase involved in cell wall biosynthesis